MNRKNYFVASFVVFMKASPLITNTVLDDTYKKHYNVV